jgi:3-deoxy-D-manno-octulosonate 8-phosphate phosphatase (KDO 8-P phosphatase)
MTRQREQRVKSRISGRSAARSIELVLMDVDGVMTDGGILFIDAKSEGRIFDAKDGVGIWLLRRAGLSTGVISGRTSAAVRRRVRELGMEEIHLKVRDKLTVYRQILERRRLSDEAVCFIGDDVVDLAVLQRVGLAVAPADAHPEVRRVATYVTRAVGGAGAVREVADLILGAQGKLNRLLRAMGRGSR